MRGHDLDIDLIFFIVSIVILDPAGRTGSFRSAKIKLPKLDFLAVAICRMQFLTTSPSTRSRSAAVIEFVFSLSFTISATSYSPADSVAVSPQKSLPLYCCTSPGPASPPTKLRIELVPLIVAVEHEHIVSSFSASLQFKSSGKFLPLCEIAPQGFYELQLVQTVCEFRLPLSEWHSIQPYSEKT